MPQHDRTTGLTVLAFLGIILVWTLITFWIPPEQIVETLGMDNGYRVAFAAGALGGFSLFLTSPYYLVVATLAAGGLHPVLLGFAAGTGVFLGDSTSYLIGRKGFVVLPSRVQRAFTKLCDWCVHQPAWLTFVVLFVYGAFVPLPNDILVVTLGVAGYSYTKLMIPLGLGNIVLNIIAAGVGAAVMG